MDIGSYFLSRRDVVDSNDEHNEIAEQWIVCDEINLSKESVSQMLVTHAIICWYVIIWCSYLRYGD